MGSRAALIAAVACVLAAPAGDAAAPPRATATAAARPAPKPKALHRARRSARTGPAAPTDPLWPASWGLQAAGAPAIWAGGSGSSRVVVAVVDTGVDAGAADLAGALVPGWSAVDDSAGAADAAGHGTAVAGVVAARAGNRIGSAGYCPRCSVMPVKVFDGSGRGPGSQIAAGIEWAVAHGADVVNLSLVLSGPDAAVSAAVADAVAHDVLVVASAGNDGGTSPNLPAAEPGVISVAADDPAQHLYPWSNGGSWVAVAAPGCNETAVGAGYGEFCGTSSATAAVSGILALALSAGASPADARAALLSTAVHDGPVPRVDARALLAAVATRASRS